METVYVLTEGDDSYTDVVGVYGSQNRARREADTRLIRGKTVKEWREAPEVTWRDVGGGFQSVQRYAVEE